jgi:hypothetical protein
VGDRAGNVTNSCEGKLPVASEREGAIDATLLHLQVKLHFVLAAESRPVARDLLANVPEHLIPLVLAL